MSSYEQDTERARRLANAANYAVYIPTKERIWDMYSDDRQKFAETAALVSIAQSLVVLTDVLESSMLH